MENLYYGLEKKNIKDIDANVLKHVFKSDDYEKVLLFIEKFTKVNNIYEFRDYLIILYLKEVLKRDNYDNFLEEFIIKYKNLNYGNVELMTFLLSHKLDYKYKMKVSRWEEWILDDFLAIAITNPNIMKLFLEKIKDTDKLKFNNCSNESSTDLCRMNIVAGNYDKALAYFISDDYKLLPETDIRQILRLNENYWFKNFDGIRDDILYQVLDELDNKKEDLNDCKYMNLLNEILYGDKVKLFNVANLGLIRSIFETDENKYLKFLLYLMEKVSNYEIALYNISALKKGEINYRNIDFLIKEESKKILKKERKIED